MIENIKLYHYLIQYYLWRTEPIIIWNHKPLLGVIILLLEYTVQGGPNFLSILSTAYNLLLRKVPGKKCVLNKDLSNKYDFDILFYVIESRATFSAFHDLKADYTYPVITKDKFSVFCVFHLL